MKRNIAKLIDHTLLKPTATERDIRRLCAEAVKYGFASVCVNPCWVPVAAKALAKSKVAVCTVIGFPLGCNDAAIVAEEAMTALEAGADEFDFVMNLGRFKAGDFELFCEYAVIINDLKLARKSVVTKLIIECCHLTDEEKFKACRCARLAGFDFVKTSTGFGPGGATIADVALMRRAVGERMGVKAAGGIRTREDALAMIEAGATRIGTSNGCSIIGG